MNVANNNMFIVDYELVESFRFNFSKSNFLYGIVSYACSLKRHMPFLFHFYCCVLRRWKKMGMGIGVSVNLWSEGFIFLVHLWSNFVVLLKSSFPTKFEDRCSLLPFEWMKRSNLSWREVKTRTDFVSTYSWILLSLNFLWPIIRALREKWICCFVFWRKSGKKEIT